MRKLTISLAAVALVGFASASAQAQCDFNGPGKAKGIKTSLIRSFAGCPSITFAGPNSQTGGGTPTCAPPYAHSPHFFDEVKGKCDFSAKAKKEDPCKDGSGVPCMNLSLKSSCGGVLRVDGISPINGEDDAGWRLGTVSRATLNDPDNGDMTVIDFPVNIGYSIPKSGKISVKTDTNAILDDLGLAALPGCAVVEVVSLSVQDPQGNPFAVIGSGTR